jgi:hypothetical protein
MPRKNVRRRATFDPMKPSPTAWRKPATGSLLSRVCRRASGAARAPRTRSNGYTRSSSAGSKRRPCCRRQTRPPCCSGRCLLQVTRFAKSNLVSGSARRQPIVSLTDKPRSVSFHRYRHMIGDGFPDEVLEIGCTLRPMAIAVPAACYGQLLDAERGLFDDTRHTVSPRSSAINSPPDRSTAKPTGLPRA